MHAQHEGIINVCLLIMSRSANKSWRLINHGVLVQVCIYLVLLIAFMVNYNGLGYSPSSIASKATQDLEESMDVTH